MSDNIYYQRYKDEPLSEESNPRTGMQMQTSAGTLTLNFKNHLDLNVILGSSQLQLDQEEYTKRQFAWGIGAKWLLFQTDSLYIDIDIKYFETLQKPLYFVSEGITYNVASNFKLNYTDTQIALGAAYRIDNICPYICIDYLYSEIKPRPPSVLVQIPGYPFLYELEASSVITNRRFGLAVGGTLIAGAKGSLTVESRFFNQNAINVSGEIRF